MIHLSSLLLHLQYCYLFIISLFSFLQFIYFFIIISYLLSIYILSSPPRCSVVNIVLIINDSLIFFAPSALILLPVHYFLIFLFYILFIVFIIISFLLFIYILSSHHRLSSVNVVLIINDSLIFSAPSSPILFPVHYFIYFHFINLFHIYILIITS